MRRADRLYELVANGGDRDILKIKELLDRDPKKFMRDRNDPGHLINQHSWNRQTPLYVACKYGNKKMVKFLLSESADPHLTSRISDKEEETVLQVAVRWNHSVIVDYLLDGVRWSQREVYDAYRVEGASAHIKRMIGVYSKARFGFCFNLALKCC